MSSGFGLFQAQWNISWWNTTWTKLRHVKSMWKFFRRKYMLGYLQCGQGREKQPRPKVWLCANTGIAGRWGYIRTLWGSHQCCVQWYINLYMQWCIICRCICHLLHADYLQNATNENISGRYEAVTNVQRYIYWTVQWYIFCCATCCMLAICLSTASINDAEGILFNLKTVKS